MINQQENYYHAIHDRLHQFRRYGKKILLLERLISCFSILIIAVLGLLLTEAVLWMESAIRLILLTISICLIGCVFIILIGKPLYAYYFQKEYPDDIQLALYIGAEFPLIRDRLADALQVFKARKREAHRTSPELAGEALEATYRDIESLDFSRVVSKSGYRQALRFFMGVLCVCLVCWFSFPDVLSSAWHRFTHPHQEFHPPLPFQLHVLPGNVTLIQGQDVHISVQCEGDAPAQLQLLITEDQQIITEKTLVSPFEYLLSNLRKSIEYSVGTDGFRSPVYRISIIQRPVVRLIQLKLYPPPYANLGVIVPEPNIGNIESLKGTRADILVQSNKILGKAEIIFKNQTNKHMQVFHQQAKGSFVVHGEEEYHVLLQDTSGLLNINPIHYTVSLKPDYPPIAHIRYPGKQIDLDESMQVPLTLEAEDDFGISKSRLLYWKKPVETGETAVPDTGYFPIVISQDVLTHVVLDTVWDLKMLELFPEDVVSYLFEVFDNDRISGPKRGRSSVFSVRFPSIYEIFQEAEKEQNNQAEILTEIFEESESLRDELEQISEELKSGEKLEWEDRKNLEQMTREQEEMEQEVRQLKNDLDQLINRMEKNDLLSLKTIEKYQELQKLYEEIATPELLESMKELQDALSGMDDKDFKQAMKNFQFSQEDFLNSIERTLSLLKRIQIEQKMDEMIKRMDDLLERQQTLNQQLGNAGASEADDLSEKETGIQKDTQTFKSEMKKLMAKMDEMEGMPLSMMESVMQTMEDESLLEQMKQMQSMIQSGQFQNAGHCGSQTVRTMSSLSDMLRQAQKELQSQHKQHVMKKLRETSFQLLQLSQGQEMLTESMKSGETNRNEASKKQMSLIEGLSQVADSLYQLGRQTFSVSPEMGKAMGKANAHMIKAIQEMTQSGNTQRASQQQQKAMGALNEAVMAIQESMNQLSGSGSGLGMEQFFLSLEQMGMQQMMINRQMMELFQQGRLSLEEQAAMARLAAEQAAVKRMLEETYQKFGDRSDIAGRLNQLAEEMEKVIEELKTNRVSQETIRRQERILSRLLDAQHSIKRRDYSRKRQAKTGQDIFRQSPADPNTSLSEVMERIRRDILRLGKEGYTEDYQALIRSYYESFIRSEADKDQ